MSENFSRSEYWIRLYFYKMEGNAYNSANSNGATNSLTEAATNSALSASGESLNNYYGDKLAAIANKSTGGVPTSTNILNPRNSSSPAAGSTPSGAPTAQDTKDLDRFRRDSVEHSDFNGGGWEGRPQSRSYIGY